MTFLFPSLLAWTAAAAVPLVLYLVYVRPQRHRVSTLLFFKALSRAHQESPWLRRLKRLLSLLLTLLVILCAVLAMSRLVASFGAGDQRQVVLLVDRSASMAAAGDEGSSLAAAIDALGDRLAAVPPSVPVTVIAYDARPEILLARSIDRRETLRTLRAIEPVPIADSPAAALRLARQVATIETPAVIWQATDRALSPSDIENGETSELEDQEQAESEVRLERFVFAPRRPVNVGLSSFALRRIPLARDRFEAFVQVHAVSPEPVEVELEVRIDERVIELRKLPIEPGGRERLTIPVAADEGATMRLVLGGVEGDALAFDNKVVARIPQLEPLRVLWVSPEPDPFTELALSALGADNRVEVFHLAPEAYPPAEPFDVVLFQQWLPETLPSDRPMIVIDPPRSVGPVQVKRISGPGLTIDRVRATDTQHPLLYGVASGRLSLRQTSVIDVDPLRSGIAPLWSSDTGPLLAAGVHEGRRLVVAAIAPGRSEALPLLASFPLLVGNAIYWTTDTQDVLEDGPNRRTGEWYATEGSELRWLDAAGEPRITTSISGSSVRLTHTGLFETDSGELGSASLLEPQETLLTDAESLFSHTASTWQAGLLSGDLTMPLLWTLFAVLLLESWLFHRKTVY